MREACSLASCRPVHPEVQARGCGLRIQALLTDIVELFRTRLG